MSRSQPPVPLSFASGAGKAESGSPSPLIARFWIVNLSPSARSTRVSKRRSPPERQIEPFTRPLPPKTNRFIRLHGPLRRRTVSASNISVVFGGFSFLRAFSTL